MLNTITFSSPPLLALQRYVDDGPDHVGCFWGWKYPLGPREEDPGLEGLYLVVSPALTIPSLSSRGRVSARLRGKPFSVYRGWYEVVA